jgi:hypothetical protein
MIKPGATDRRSVIKTTMWAMPVVVMKPGIHLMVALG